MTTIEEQLWDYIDGNGSAEHRAETARKIASDEAYQSLYQELVTMHQQMSGISLDEPSMSFTRNIMELVQLEKAPVSLKTKVDNRIIYSIAAFFLMAIAAILIFAASQIHLTAPKISVDIDPGRYVTPLLIKTFLFIDIIIGFLYLDSLLRKKKI